MQSAKKQLLTGVIFLNMPPQRSCLSLATFTFFSIVRFLFSLDICSVRQQSQRGLNRGALSSSCWQNIVVDLTHLTSHILLLRHRHNCQSSTCHLNVLLFTITVSVISRLRKLRTLKRLQLTHTYTGHNCSHICPISSCEASQFFTQVLQFSRLALIRHSPGYLPNKLHLNAGNPGSPEQDLGTNLWTFQS